MPDLPPGLSPLDFKRDYDEGQMAVLLRLILTEEDEGALDDDPRKWPLCEKHHQPPGTCPYCHHGFPEPNG